MRRRTIPAGLFPRNSRWFDGVDDRITGTNSLAGATASTLAVWMRCEKIVTPGNVRIALQTGASAGSQSSWLGANLSGGLTVVGGGFYGLVNCLWAGRDFTQAGWVRAVFTHAGGLAPAYLYVNGVLVSVSVAVTPNYTGGEASIGRSTDGSYPFGGNVWDARMYSRAWTPAEVAADFKGEPVDPTGLSRSWALNDQTVATTYESVVGTNDVVTGALISRALPTRRRRVPESVPSTPVVTCVINDNAALQCGAGSFGWMEWISRNVHPLPVLYTQKEDGVGRFRVGIDTTGLYAYIWDGAISVFAYDGIGSAGRTGWIHVAVCCDRASGLLKFYVDGQFAGQGTLGALGAVNNGGQLLFAGATDVYSRGYNDILWRKGDIFTLEEVEANYYDTVIPGNLTSHWHCREGAGTTINDLIGGHNGTLLAASWSTATRSKQRQVA